MDAETIEDRCTVFFPSPEFDLDSLYHRLRTSWSLESQLAFQVVLARLEENKHRSDVSKRMWIIAHLEACVDEGRQLLGSDCALRAQVLQERVTPLHFQKPTLLTWLLVLNNLQAIDYEQCEIIKVLQHGNGMCAIVSPSYILICQIQMFSENTGVDSKYNWTSLLH